MPNLKEWQTIVHKGARDRGWYDGELGEKTELRLASLLCLIHSEVSEALEEIRRGKLDYYYPYAEHLVTSDTKPLGLPTELADIIIRVLDMAEWLGIDMEEAVRMKNEYNETRGYKHGGKKL